MYILPLRPLQLENQKDGEILFSTSIRKHSQKHGRVLAKKENMQEEKGRGRLRGEVMQGVVSEESSVCYNNQQ